ncbi:type II toxin-antitoxin system ribonuclease VapC29 [Pseudonocardia eucalypti]|uniref:Ribonuclease VapC n=1 Tax=Pseudonocardia eucalypti TaxID=648755 RepID=A0ABP9Q0Y5_9PSEU
MLDANVLIALSLSDHVHHNAAQDWLARCTDPVASCPITEGSLVRQVIRAGYPADEATALLARIARQQRHEFWPDTLSYRDVSFAGVVGHRQVTDTYLAHLARAHQGRLATFDRGLASLHADVAELVPTEPPGPPRPRDPD